MYEEALEQHKARGPQGGVFVKAATDRFNESRDGAQVDLVWTSGFAAHGPGSYFDYCKPEPVVQCAVFGVADSPFTQLPKAGLSGGPMQCGSKSWPKA